MRSLLGAVVIAALAPPASAQAPGATPPRQQITPLPPPIILEPELSTTWYAVGGVVGTLYGFGVGHAVQGRYFEDGLFYTIGEAASVAMFGISFAHLVACDENCGRHEMFAVAGGLAFVAMRIIETVDLWTEPHGAATVPQVQWTLLPTGDGVRAGLLLSF